MSKRVKNVMSKLNGTDLGRLLLKDTITGMAGDSRAYENEDFEIAFRGMDSRNRRQYLKYVEIADCILSRSSLFWWVGSAIEAATLRFEVMRWIMKFCQLYELASESLLSQRISYGTSSGEWHDPGEEEILLRDLSKQLRESFLENREGIEELHSYLKKFVILYLTLDKTLKALAEVLELPEIATIARNSLHHVEELRQEIKDELDELPEDSP